MKKIIKIPAIILVVGIFISFFRLITGTGGSGLGNFMDTVLFTSLLLFFSTLVLLVFRFKQLKSKFIIWLYFTISAPLTTMFLYGFVYDIIVSTATPDSYQNFIYVDKSKYSQDSSSLVSLIDSLVQQRITYTPAERNLRYFDGATYNDSIERSWSIDLPLKNNKYLESMVDTLFYSPYDNNLMAGLLIIPRFYDLTNSDKLEYYGCGFIAIKRNNQYHIQILKSRTSNKDLDACSEYLFKMYCRRTKIEKDRYNMNDKRFWNDNSLINRLKKESVSSS